MASYSDFPVLPISPLFFLGDEFWVARIFLVLSAFGDLLLSINLAIVLGPWVILNVQLLGAEHMSISYSASMKGYVTNSMLFAPVPY